MTVWKDLKLPDIFIGDIESFDNITLVPLRLESEFEAQTIVDAQEKDVLEILESDSVNKLKLKINKAGKYFIPFLQVVGGGKQDRMVTRPYIINIENKKTVEIPVNCVEQGRWQYSRQSTGEQTTDKFEAKKGVRMSPSIGSLNISAVQGMTWSSIDWYQRRRGIRRDISPSMSFMELEQAVLDNQKDSVDSDNSGFKKLTDNEKILIKKSVFLIPDQTGLALLIDNKIRVIELFGNKNIWKEQSESVANSFISEIEIELIKESEIEKFDSKDVRSSINDVIHDLNFEMNKNDEFGTYYTFNKDNLSSLLFLENNIIVEFYLAKSKIKHEINNSYSNIVQEQTISSEYSESVKENEES